MIFARLFPAQGNLHASAGSMSTDQLRETVLQEVANHVIFFEGFVNTFNTKSRKKVPRNSKS